jgi:hypothetical protein
VSGARNNASYPGQGHSMSKADARIRHAKVWGPFFRPAVVAIGCWLAPMVLYGIVQVINDELILLYLILLYAASLGLFCYFGVRVGAELFNSDPISATSNALACVALFVCFETQGVMFYGLDTAEAYARQTAVLLSQLGGSQDPLQSVPDKELRNALEKGLKSLSEARRTDYSRTLHCTEFFSEFYRYRQLGPYVAFFKALEISPVFDNFNKNGDVDFGMDYIQLWRMGYTGFFRGDQLGIIFTTASVDSADITKFRATLLNTYFELF